MGLRGAYLSGRSLTGMARLAGATTVRLGPTATSALLQTSMLGAEVLAWNSPWLSPMFTGAKLSNNDCDFPSSGHVHNFEVRVYDPAKLMLTEMLLVPQECNGHWSKVILLV